MSFIYCSYYFNDFCWVFLFVCFWFFLPFPEVIFISLSPEGFQHRLFSPGYGSFSSGSPARRALSWGENHCGDLGETLLQQGLGPPVPGPRSPRSSTPRIPTGLM